ncbi:MAG: iron-sulfur cluster assembly protein, partial [Acidobacteriota bacterium]
MSQLTEEIVLNSLRQIIDPDLHKDIVKLGFIRDLKIEDGHVAFRIVLTTP